MKSLQTATQTTIKAIAVIFTALSLLVVSFPACADDKESGDAIKGGDKAQNRVSRVAVFDVEVIYRTDGIHRRLYLLKAEKEIKEIFVDIEKQTQEILRKIIASEDRVEIDTLKDRERLLERKRDSIESIVKKRGRSRERVEEIYEFINKKYSDKYDILLDIRALNRCSENIFLTTRPVDITKTVIQDLTDAINGVE